jgi:hypothetical protein
MCCGANKKMLRNLVISVSWLFFLYQRDTNLGGWVLHVLVFPVFATLFV